MLPAPALYSHPVPEDYVSFETAKLAQEVSVQYNVDEKGEPVVKLSYQDKTKTLFSEFSINRFLGVYHGLLYEQVKPENYIIAGLQEDWDYGIKMTAEEWCKCVMAIYKVFG